jgi:drug/metabolite transporter (DMT)-like permease
MKKGNFHPYAVMAIVGWALAYVYTRVALQHFSAYSLGFLRYFLASCVLAALVALFKVRPPAKKDLGLFLTSGILGFSLYVIVFNIGSATVTSATASVIVSTAPVITALLARVFYGERLSALQWFAIAVEFIGVAVLALGNGIFMLNAGVLWLALAALALGSYNLTQRTLTRSYTAFQASAFSIFAGTLVLAVFAPSSIGELPGAPPDQLYAVAILGVFSSGAAYVAWSKALETADDTSSVSNYMFLTPFAAALLGFIIAGEVPDSSTLLGGTIILAGVLAFNLGKRRARKDSGLCPEPHSRAEGP